MELFLGMLFLVGTVGLGLGTLVWRDRSWNRVGDDYGLHYESEGIFGERRLSGEVHGVPIEVGAERTGEERDKDRQRVTAFSAGEGTIPASINARAEGGWRRLVNVFVTTDVEVGDKDIDKRLRLEGAQVELSAVLSHQGRNDLLNLLDDHNAALEDGVVLSEKRGWLIRERRLREHLDEMLRVATELSATTDELPARLRHNALNDPVAKVRDTCAKLVMHHYPDSQEALDVATARKNHADPEIAMLAALVLREPDAVLEMIHDRSRSADVRAIGLRHLSRIARVRGLDLVNATLGGKPGPLRVAACQAVADYDLKAALPALDAMAPEAKTEEATPIFMAALRLGGPAQAASVAWVLDKLDGEERRDAARHIREQGDMRCIEPLTVMTKGALRSAEVKQTAKGLVATLRDRLNLREQSGGLTVVEEASGGLGLVSDAQDGALSEVAPEPQKASAPDSQSAEVQHDEEGEQVAG